MEALGPSEPQKRAGKFGAAGQGPQVGSRVRKFAKVNDFSGIAAWSFILKVKIGLRGTYGGLSLDLGVC